MFDAAQTAADTAGNALDLLFGPVQANTEPAEPAQCVSPWPRLRPVSTADPAQEARLAALVARFAASDQKALSELYDLTVSRIFTMARSITRNRQCAEEVTEDVYWQVWRQALRFDAQRGTVMAWLLTLARSRALDHLRRSDAALARPEARNLIDESADPHADPAQLLSTSQTEQLLAAALQILDSKPRQLLALAFYRGLTHEEIAAQTDLPLGTVKSNIRRALATLRTHLISNPGTQTALTR